LEEVKDVEMFDAASIETKVVINHFFLPAIHHISYAMLFPVFFAA
jgi:hypothetical protein